MQFEGYPKILNEFAGYKSVIQGCAKKTVDEYMVDLRTFFRFLKSRGQVLSDEEFEAIAIDDVDVEYISRITSMDIYEFLMYLERERGNSW